MEILLLLILTLLNGLLAMSEMAVVSLRKALLRRLATSSIGAICRSRSSTWTRTEWTSFSSRARRRRAVPALLAARSTPESASATADGTT